MCPCEIKKAGEGVQDNKQDNKQRSVGFRELLIAGRLFYQQSNSAKGNSIPTLL